MKHHIVFKFLAVFLCAASLLGVVASGLGLFAMTELGLREQSPVEAREESLRSSANDLANELVVRFAAKDLGGADESLISQYYGNYWIQNNFDWSQVGYVIRDEEGNVLVAATSDGEENAAVYEIFTTGSRYIHVLNKMTQDEYEEKYHPVTEPAMTMPPEVEVDYCVYNAVPEKGCDIGQIYVTYADGSTGEYGGPNAALGRLMWFMDRQLRLDFYNYDHSPAAQNLISDFQNGYAVVSIVLTDTEDTVVLDASYPHGLVEEFCGSHGSTYVLFRSLEETSSEMGSIYDAIPAEGQNVATVYVKYADGQEESMGGVPDIGFIGYDEEGYVVFTANVGMMDLRTERVVHIKFADSQGELVYEASDYASVGQFVLENDTLIFTSRETAAVPQPSVSEKEIHIYDDVPPLGYAVYEMDLWLEDSNQILTITGTDNSLGLADHDAAGNVVFTARDWKDFVFSKPAQIRYILMKDRDGRILYEAYQAGARVGEGEPIGYFAYNETGDLVFGPITDRVAWASILERAQTEPVSTDEDAAVDPAEATEAADTEVTEPVWVEETQLSTVPTEAPDTTDATEPVLVPVETLRVVEQDGLQFFGYYDSAMGEEVVVEYTYEATPPYWVEISMGPGALQNQYEWVLVELVYLLQDYLIPGLIVSLVLFAIMAVYLCCAAGKKPGTLEVRAGGLNCVPIDLYLAAAAGGIFGCAFALVEGVDYLLRKDIQTGILFGALCAYGACLLFVGFCFAFAAQVKTPGGYFWRNSICGRSLKVIAWLWRKFLRLCGWLWKFLNEKLKPLMVRLAKALWKLTKFFFLQLKKGTVWLCRKILQGCDWLSRILGRFLSMLPLTWQFLLIGFSLVIFLYIMIRTYKVGYLLIGFGVFFGVILYAASAFGILLENAKRMRKGDLDTKVDDKLLIGAFREFGDELNGLADVAVVAAQKQLKSERMKTELITNVSHDIKTPLTSIINYVDLMEKPHSPEEQAAYLEVLSRQSMRLKKLIDDLMEMSKASTGNMAVDITRVNAGEAVNQALGEFSDKLEKAQLIPVFRQPDKDIHMMADGRLVWRVLSNLLSNTVKYALPGTRVYIDLMELEGKVVLSVKNISQEPLNVTAEELLERFVRGDAARNTEGSGLGLNIAQSLMELQKGKLELLVDGDLFKVTLIFPGV